MKKIEPPIGAPDLIGAISPMLDPIARELSPLLKSDEKIRFPKPGNITFVLVEDAPRFENQAIQMDTHMLLHGLYVLTVSSSLSSDNLPGSYFLSLKLYYMGTKDGDPVSMAQISYVFTPGEGMFREIRIGNEQHSFTQFNEANGILKWILAFVESVISHVEFVPAPQLPFTHGLV